MMGPMARVPRFLAAILLVLLLMPGRARADDPLEAGRDLEPVPPGVVFTRPGEQHLDAETARELHELVQRSFSSLGDVVRGRDLIVKRYGLVAVPTLMEVLAANRNVTEVANAALTIGALRDRYGPALELKPAIRLLYKVLDDDGPLNYRVMAALALGCFHHDEAHMQQRFVKRAGDYHPEPGVATLHGRAAEWRTRGRRAVVQHVNDPTALPRVAAMFALAKMGGAEAREAFVTLRLADITNPQPLRATLLTRAFLVVGEAKPFLDGLKHGQAQVRSTAALGLAVAMLQDEPAEWTRDEKLIHSALRPLTLPNMAGRDVAQAWFARGVGAWVHQSNEEWHAVWDAAVQGKGEPDVAAACAEILNFCRMPWFESEIGRWTRSPPIKVKEPVLALLLMRAGERGDPSSLGPVLEWLNSRSKRPAPNVRWDPRWYAILGLARALHEGRIKPRADRERVIAALRKAAETTLARDAPMRHVLAAILGRHGAQIIQSQESALHILPLAAVREIQGAFACPYGLTAGDPVDACVQRVNDEAFRVLGLDGIPAWKPGGDNTKKQPERFLRRYVDTYPYFRRLEFRADRGARPPPALPTDVVGGIDR